MHHAPAGPPPSARLLALLAPARRGLRLLRHTRLLPTLLGGLVIAALAFAAPLPAGGRAPASTAALTSPSDGGRELVPATGDGWTRDGRPPAPDGAAAPEPVPGSDTADGSAPVATGEAPEPSAAGAPALPASAPDTSSAGARTTAPSTPAGPGTTTPTAPARSTASETSDSSTPSSSPPRPPSPPSSSPPRPPSPPPHPSPSVPSPSAEAVATAADHLLAAVDTARTAAGCEPLTADAGLVDAATAHSRAMRNSAALQLPPGSGAVAEGSTDPAAVAAAWLADPTVPLTDCTLTSAGVGVVDDWWTLLLAPDRS